MNKPRQTGMLLPLWTLSHKGDFGIGDLGSLRKYIPWVAETGLDFLQLLPVNECDQSNSPYSAISSVALDPIYLDLGLVEGLSTTDLISTVEKTDKVDYQAVRLVKDQLLRKAYGLFEPEKSVAFREFQERESEWLSTYSLFRFLMALEDESPSWQDWSEEYNDPEKALQWIEGHLVNHADTIYPEIVYYEWLQWQCDQQWRRMREFADSYHVKLMGDIPVGVSFNSADVFFEQDNFNLKWFGGAPPETHFKDDPFAIQWGQNWGIPLYNDDYLRQSDFAWWKRRVRKHTEIFSMFRVDHILGLYRIYSFPWHPSKNKKFLGLTPEQALVYTNGELPQFYPAPDDSDERMEANLQRGDEIITHLLKAADGAEIIAEDLGMTPSYVRPHLKSKKVAGFRICHWEADSDARPCPTEKYEYHSFATYSTHDHPPIKPLWEDYRQKLYSEDSKVKADAQHNLRILGQIARVNLPEVLETPRDVPRFGADIQWALLDYLLQTNSRYAAFMITDLLGTSDRFNTPSTTGDHNWTHRLEHPVEAFYDKPVLRELSRELRLRIKLLRTAPPYT